MVEKGKSVEWCWQTNQLETENPKAARESNDRDGRWRARERGGEMARRTTLSLFRNDVGGKKQGEELCLFARWSNAIESPRAAPILPVVKA